ncbi:hypothetical protein JYU03_00365, partial [bacterium AH-315-F03]|nr:hypothetical protein [bacterium AH-315-F03]
MDLSSIVSAILKISEAIAKREQKYQLRFDSFWNDTQNFWHTKHKAPRKPVTLEGNNDNFDPIVTQSRVLSA